MSQFHSEERSELMDAWRASSIGEHSTPVDAGLRSVVRAYILGRAQHDAESSRESIRGSRLRLTPVLSLVPRSAYGMAAAIAILLGTSFLLAPRIHIVSAPVGSISPVNFTLPDGTSGSLSAGSRIRYSDTFGSDARRVVLKGEAMFDVVNDGTPFLVDTYGTRIAVKGTSFSVRAWPDDVQPVTIVKVREGRVAVSRRYNMRNYVELRPAQKIQLADKEELTPQLVASTTDHAFSWLAGKIDFVNMPIGSVLNELSRRYDIRLTAPLSIRDRRITLLPSEHASIDDVLIDMAAAVNIRYRKIAGGYEFYKEENH